MFRCISTGKSKIAYGKYDGEIIDIGDNYVFYALKNRYIYPITQYIGNGAKEDDWTRMIRLKFYGISYWHAIWKKKGLDGNNITK